MYIGVKPEELRARARAMNAASVNSPNYTHSNTAPSSRLLIITGAKKKIRSERSKARESSTRATTDPQRVTEKFDAHGERAPNVFRSTSGLYSANNTRGCCSFRGTFRRHFYPCKTCALETFADLSFSLFDFSSSESRLKFPRARATIRRQARFAADVYNRSVSSASD